MEQDWLIGCPVGIGQCHLCPRFLGHGENLSHAASKPALARYLVAYFQEWAQQIILLFELYTKIIVLTISSS